MNELIATIALDEWLDAKARIAELEACILEYWHAKDWDAIGAADAKAAKLLPADMRKRASLTKGNTHGL